MWDRVQDDRYPSPTPTSIQRSPGSSAEWREEGRENMSARCVGIPMTQLDDPEGGNP